MSSLQWKPRVPDLAEAGGKRPIDPYLLWGLSTEFRGYRTAQDASLTWLSFIARVKTSSTMPDALDAVDACDWLHVPPIYREPVKGTSEFTRIVTGAVHKDHLAELIALACIDCFELGLPVATPSTRTQPAPKEAPPIGPSRRPDGQASGNVIGIIDYGGPFLHPAFRKIDDSSATRFFSVWDQGTPLGGDKWHVPGGFAYGREIDAQSIDELIRTATPSEQLYAQLNYSLDKDDVRQKRVLRDTHGAHVCDMLAGHFDPLDSVRLGRGVVRAPGDDGIDTAAKAPILFVQIPLPTLVDSSGGSLNVHILDAIRYIIDRSSETANIVINISYGQNGGPHDGSSLLEQAMDDLVTKTGGRLLLFIGAGNSRQDGAHAQLNVSCAAPEVLSWNVPSNDITDSFLEIWYPDKVDNVATELGIEVRPPGGTWCPIVSMNGAAMVLERDGVVVAQLVHRNAVPNGNGAMALLSLAPTLVVASTAPGTVPAPVGTWDIRLSTQMLGYAVPVHAWIEREDMPDTLARSEFRSHVSDACTVNGIATGKQCIVVGGIRSSDKQPVPYSGMGPTRDPGRKGTCPVVFAECEESDALYGIRAGTMMPGNTLRMGGTSVASPAAARRVFNELGEVHDGKQRGKDTVAPGYAPSQKPPTARKTAEDLIKALGRVFRQPSPPPSR